MLKQDNMGTYVKYHKLKCSNLAWKLKYRIKADAQIILLKFDGIMSNSL